MKSNVNPRIMRHVQKELIDSGEKYSAVDKTDYTKKCHEEEQGRKLQLASQTNSNKKPVVCADNFSKDSQMPLTKGLNTVQRPEKVMQTEKNNIYGKGLPPLYQCAADLKKVLHFIYYSGNLFYFNGKCYDVLNEREVVGLYRKMVDDRMGYEKSMNTIMQLYKFLCTDPEIYIEKVPNNLRMQFAPSSGHWCVCQRPLGGAQRPPLLRLFDRLNDNNVVLRCPLHYSVG